MPITSTVNFEALDQNSFHQVDRRIMRAAFDTHNQMGRLLDEKIYHSALEKACQRSAVECHREVEIKATFSSYTKSFYLDLLVQNGAIYEIKTSRALTNNHEAQLMNYLLLSGIQHGKLINFRPSSVEYRFISTSLKPCDRFSFTINAEQWISLSENCEKIKALLHGILHEWGSHLHIDLYRDALIELIGGKQLFQPIDLFMNSNKVGYQDMCLLSPITALQISSIKSGILSYQNHLLRLLHSTNLKHIQWLNFNNHEITLRTLHKNDSVVK